MIGVPKETFPGERRVALVPAAVKPLAKLGLDLIVETGAGMPSGYADADYAQAGATIASTRAEVFQKADLIAQIRAAGANPNAGSADLPLYRQGQCIFAQCDPLTDPRAMQSIADKGAAVFALEMVPRITRAQSMDVLSSMATIAGYKAVLLAASHLPQLFPMMMTAAGTLAPARVFIIGAGVAGLQAISTARRLGAVVQAYDVRPDVKEQCESLGAKFVELELKGAEGQGGYAKEMGEDFLRRQRELMLKVVAASDVVITTAAVPGKKAPTLLTAEMVQAMPAGSVVVDIAAERGGNCELTHPGQTITAHNVTIIGPLNLPSDIPRHASQMFSNNILALLKTMVKDGKLTLKVGDEVIAGTLMTRSGKVVHPKIRELCGLPPLEDELRSEQAEAAKTPPPPPPETSADTYRLAGS